LFIFSTLNPTNTNNNVTGASLKLFLMFTQQNGLTNNFTIFENENPSKLEMMDDATRSYFNFTKSIYTKNFATDQMQTITMYTASDNAWTVSQPQIEAILGNMKNSSTGLSLGVTYQFKRPNTFQSTSGQDTSSTFTYPLWQMSCTNVSSYACLLMKNSVQNIQESLTRCTKRNISLPNFYSPTIQMSTAPQPSVLIGNPPDPYLSTLMNGTFGFHCENFTNADGSSKPDYSDAYWFLRVMTPNNTDQPYNRQIPYETGLRFYTFSNLASTISSGYDVLTFYVSFVLLLGNLIRGFISGEAEKIVITETPEPGKVLNLCEGIKISRYRHDFVREEHLYCVLIDMMRSPEILKIITKSSIQFLLNKNNPAVKKNNVLEKHKDTIAKKND